MRYELKKISVCVGLLYTKTGIVKPVFFRSSEASEDFQSQGVPRKSADTFPQLGVLCNRRPFGRVPIQALLGAVRRQVLLHILRIKNYIT